VGGALNAWSGFGAMGQPLGERPAAPVRRVVRSATATSRSRSDGDEPFAQRGCRRDAAMV